MLSIGVLLALDMLLLSGFFFFLKKRAAHNDKAAASWKTPEVTDNASMNKKEVHTETPRLYPEVSDLERLEQSLLEKGKRLDDLTKRIEDRLKNIDLLYEEQLDVYSLAMRMVKNGDSQEDISKKLGLLNGEAELIESISNLRTS